jgi:ElaB/YqjD/DUF883 family membrane-anchored ribosome-binding protein
MSETAVSGSSRIDEHLADGPLVSAARTVESTARRAKERVTEAKDRLAEKSIGELVENGRDYVRENPGKTILLSMGVGALIGYVIGRRRS